MSTQRKSANTEVLAEQFVLVIYMDMDNEHLVDGLIGPFDNEELAYLHVDKIREKLDSGGLSWLFSVWPLTKVCEQSEP